MHDRYTRHLRNMKDENHKEEFYKGLREFGLENFSYEILETFDTTEWTKDLLDERETYYIKKFNCKFPNGYNMNNGGKESGCGGFHLSKIVEQYDLFGNFIAEYFSAHEATRQTGINFSDICACCRKEKPYANNYQWKYKDNKNHEITNIFSSDLILYNWPIQRYSLTGHFVKEYNSFKEACEDITVSKSSLCNCLKKKTKTCANNLWIYKGQELVIPQHKYQNCGGKKPVLQYDINNNFIKEYKSASEASRATGVAVQSISRACLGKSKTAGKYIWKYKI